MNHKHEYAHGTLTEEERADHGISVVVCQSCDLRVVISGGALSAREKAWALEVVARHRGTPTPELLR